MPLRSITIALVLSLSAQVFAFGTTSDESTQQPVPIGVVQGHVADDASGARFASPLQGRDVLVRGIVTQKIMQPRAGRDPLFGVFVQNRPGECDGDARTSDGIYVYLGGKDRVRGEGGGDRDLTVGDEVVLRGRVAEYHYLTQLSRPTLVHRVRRSVDLDEEVPAIDLVLPSDADDAARVLERLEGMRVRVPAGAVAIGGRKSYDEVPIVLPTRNFPSEDPFSRRVFRDPHPLDNDPESLFDDENGDRLVLAAYGLAALADDDVAVGADKLMPPTRTFDVLAKPVIGALDYNYGTFKVQAAATPEFARGPDPSAQHAPGAPERSREISIASLNVENLYDLRDDPDDQNDHPGDSGSGGIRKPFNYLPADDAEYEARLSAFAEQVVADLHAPDVLMIQEVEDQDILGREGSNGADGRPDILQELAHVIEGRHGIRYEAALDRDGADVRGIVCGYLYRTDRVRLATPASLAKVLAGLEFPTPPHPGNAKATNPRCMNFVRPDVEDPDGEGSGAYVFSRAPQVALFEVFQAEIGEGEAVPLVVLNNHFSSRPTDRVEQRRYQAKACAAIAAAVMKHDAEALVVVGGDLNVYPRPDDPFPSGHPRHPSDQLASLYETGLANLYDRVLEEAPASAYSYVYQGQAQTLDHLFLSPALASRVTEARYVHVNCDWPSDYEDDGARGLSDHDPIVARVRLW